MSNIKHTPGPWNVEKVSHRHAVVDNAQNGKWELIAETTSEANAALIAAAPEMLEALELAQHIIFDASKKLSIPIYGDFETESDQYSYICAVIAKARGGI